MTLTPMGQKEKNQIDFGTYSAFMLSDSGIYLNNLLKNKWLQLISFKSELSLYN
jgi:hypothetical protein